MPGYLLAQPQTSIGDSSIMLGKIHSIGELSSDSPQLPFKVGDRIAWAKSARAFSINETLDAVALGAIVAYEPADSDAELD